VVATVVILEVPQGLEQVQVVVLVQVRQVVLELLDWEVQGHSI
jgi:hypothetical protein